MLLLIHITYHDLYTQFHTFIDYLIDLHSQKKRRTEEAGIQFFFMG